MGQASPRRATAHGVQPASIRLGWVWLLRPTAHGVLLASTSLDQVCTRPSGFPPAALYNPCTTLCLLRVIGRVRETDSVLGSQSQRDRGNDTIGTPADMLACPGCIETHNEGHWQTQTQGLLSRSAKPRRFMSQSCMRLSVSARRLMHARMGQA
jgi:hypothetical protein